MYEYYNPSPAGLRTGDCAVRALAKVLNVDWDTAYMMLAVKGLQMYEMPNANSVIHALLTSMGYHREVIPNTCPDCYTVGQFADDHPEGTYILGTGSHLVAVESGVAFDTWDSTSEIPIYYWTKEA